MFQLVKPGGAAGLSGGFPGFCVLCGFFFVGGVVVEVGDGDFDADNGVIGVLGWCGAGEVGAGTCGWVVVGRGKGGSFVGGAGNGEGCGEGGGDGVGVKVWDGRVVGLHV